MSSYEYNDMFLKCQKTAPYHIYIFDIKNSKKMNNINREIATMKLIKFITLMYNKIHLKEIEHNIIILLKNKEYGFIGKQPKEFGMKQEPFILGDLVGFTIYRDSIKQEEIMELFKECVKEANIDFEFHIADGYYETDNWIEAGEKYFRGYCIDVLSNMHKPCNKKLRKLIKENNIKI